MNIEESIKIVKCLILYPTNWIVNKEKYKGNLKYIGSIEGNEAIETLLTAYEKEKKKNKKLEADIEMFTKKFDNESLECRIKQKIAKLNHYNSMYLISNGKYSKVIQKQIKILQDTLKGI